MFYTSSFRLKKYILEFLLVIWACSFYSCSEDPELTSPSGGTFTPTITIPSSSIDGSTITISWGGNEFSQEFSYRYKLTTDAWPENAWSDWKDVKEIILPYLDEGNYIFEVKSRFEAGTESDPSSFEFPINDVIGPALRFYPLYKEVEGTDVPFMMDVYAEEVTNLVGAQFEFTYDPSMVSFISTGPGSFLETSSHILIEEHDPAAGTVHLTLSTTEDAGVGLTGTGSLVQISLQRTLSSSSSNTFDLDFSEGAVWTHSSTPNSFSSFSMLVKGVVDLP